MGLNELEYSGSGVTTGCFRTITQFGPLAAIAGLCYCQEVSSAEPCVHTIFNSYIQCGQTLDVSAGPLLLSTAERNFCIRS